ncbi:hypothetical protein BDP55DRAFT_752492 [Colletotrichum godetiae]|uniref:Uncharacterized protein n=1 Tax=Colletotrichum godetiae TaxID=1209918 RepID=A0AAJ0ACU4_9PEZI|nr:uncharacterized protein BDP55DRAFT_752492 [Colletotrichum godetiae]KAK1671583.1 hypothetical protein BDP55DRAFT_752492 [Colletotrichum godetiae]
MAPTPLVVPRPSASLSAGIREDDYNMRNTITIAAACVVYTIAAVVFYASLNRCRFLLKWYENSARRLHSNILLLLWLSATLTFWPIALALAISSKCGFDIVDKFTSLLQRVKRTGNAMCRHISGERREGMELERWKEIELEEGNSDVLRKNTTMGNFINPFDDRGRSSTRSSSGSSSSDQSPTDRRASPSAREITPIRWYERLPSPTEMARALDQVSPRSRGCPSSAGRSRSESPYSDDSDARQPTTILFESANTAVPNPGRKSKMKRMLQTIPEQTDEVKGWETMII